MAYESKAQKDWSEAIARHKAENPGERLHNSHVSGNLTGTPKLSGEAAERHAAIQKKEAFHRKMGKVLPGKFGKKHTDLAEGYKKIAHLHRDRALLHEVKNTEPMKHTNAEARKKNIKEAEDYHAKRQGEIEKEHPSHPGWKMVFGEWKRTTKSLENDLEKGDARGGKYYRRVPTGNPKRPWRYYYTKAAYERDHGDGAHRDGASEKKQEMALNEVYEPVPYDPSNPDHSTYKHHRMMQGYHDAKEKELLDRLDNEKGSSNPIYRVMERLRNEASYHGANANKHRDYAKKLHNPKIHGGWNDAIPTTREALAYGQTHTKSMDAIDQLGALAKGIRPKLPTLDGPKFAAPKKPRVKSAKKTHPVSESQRRWAFAAEARGELPKGKAKTWARRTKGESLPDSTEKSMDIPRSAQMSKGLYSFAFDARDKLQGEIKDAWLADYVDAFIEEAYEHERQERLHQDPSLLPAGEDPAKNIVNAVYNEFIMYCAKNKILARAKDKVPVTKDYVSTRMQELGLSHVPSENLTADQEASVAGYHPQPLQLSMDAFAAAQLERNEAIARMGALHKSEDYVSLDAGDNPMAGYAETSQQRARQLSKAYGGDGSVPQHDPNCPFHGHDPLRSGGEHSVVHGAVCTCR